MKRLMIIVSISFLTILFISCAIKPNFIAHSFVYPTIRTEGIAILPVAGEMIDRSTRKDIGLNFERELSEKYPNVKVVGVLYTGRKLVESNLVEEYKEFISTYQMTEIIVPEKLEKIRNAIGLRYLVVPIVQSYNKQAVYDKEGVKKGDKYTIILESQVYDNLEKKIVFRILTSGEDTPSGWMFDKQTLKKAAEEAVKIAVKAFPKPE